MLSVQALPISMSQGENLTSQKNCRKISLKCQMKPFHLSTQNTEALNCRLCLKSFFHQSVDLEICPRHYHTPTHHLLSSSTTHCQSSCGERISSYLEFKPITYLSLYAYLSFGRPGSQSHSMV